MNFDIPQMHIQANSEEARVIEAIIRRDHVTPEQAIRTALRNLATEMPDSRDSAGPRSKSKPEQISGGELAAFDQAFPGLSALDEVTDEQWDRIDTRVQEMKREGLSLYA